MKPTFSFAIHVSVHHKSEPPGQEKCIVSKLSYEYGLLPLTVNTHTRQQEI